MAEYSSLSCDSTYSTFRSKEQAVAARRTGRGAARRHAAPRPSRPRTAKDAPLDLKRVHYAEHIVDERLRADLLQQTGPPRRGP
jgi:hypothetical protein